MNSLPRITVLIVDDSRADTRLAQLWLQKSAWIHDTHVVHCGREALSFLRQGGPGDQNLPAQLVLVDVQLPDMLGWELIAELRRDEALADLPVVVLTGATCDEDARRAQSLGVALYRAKPFDAEEFTAFAGEIERLLAREYGPGFGG